MCGCVNGGLFSTWTCIDFAVSYCFVRSFAVTSEALKRKSTVGAGGDASEEASAVDEATPEKKAKLDAAPEEAQPEVVAESEAAEVAA